LCEVRSRFGRPQDVPGLAKNQELVERCQKLLGKLNSLRDINKDLQEKLDLAKRKLNFLEVGVEVQVAMIRCQAREESFSVDALLGEYFNTRLSDSVGPWLHVYRRFAHLLDLQ
jgi:hypothetical protein